MSIRSLLITLLIGSIVSTSESKEKPEDQIDQDFNHRIESSLLELNLDQKEELTKEEIRAIILKTMAKGNMINVEGLILNQLSAKLLENIPEIIPSTDLKSYLSFDKVSLIISYLFEKNAKKKPEANNRFGKINNDQDF